MIIFLATGCRNSTESDNYPPEGKTLVKIDNSYFTGSAGVSSRILNEHRYELIQLELVDSISIEILADEFLTGKFEWNRYNPGPEIIFSLMYNFYGGTIYNPYSGVFLIQEITLSQITGTFDLKMHDVAASCSDCPGTFKYIEGKFRAIKM